jgi:hypothetical protein
MTTVTVPVKNKILASIEQLTANGTGTNIYKALQKYIEDQEILAAMNEPTFSGDLDDLLEQILRHGY